MRTAPTYTARGGGQKRVRKLDRKTDPDRSDRWNRRKGTRPNNEGADNPTSSPCFFFSLLRLFLRARIRQLLQARKMPRSPPCLSQWSSLWFASLATLVVHSVLSYSYSSSSPSAHQRPATAGKRPGFMERTLILLDVNTRSPIQVLNDNFLSLQLDPSIIKDGWLDFLRYRELPVTIC